MKSRMRKVYEEEVIPLMVKKFNYKNSMQVPRIEKVCVNVGVSVAKTDSKALEIARKDLSLITGQWPLTTRAKKSIASFNLRKGMLIGCKVTLRGEIMFEFLDRLFNLVIPRIRDFQGISPHQFDSQGNFTLGIEDRSIFPEVGYKEVKKSEGLSITIVTTAKEDKEARELLTSLGMPFKENGEYGKKSSRRKS